MQYAHYAEVITQDARAYSSLMYAPYTGSLSKWNIVEIDQTYTGLARRRSQRPVAMLVAAYNSPLIQQRSKLSKIGFHVMAAHSLLDGYTQTLQLLALPQAIRPTVVLLDIPGTQPGFPELSGSLIAAVLAQHMQLREIHVAWLVGLGEHRDSQGESEALIAGCHHVLGSTLSQDSRLMLKDLAARPAPMPHLNARPDQARIIRVLQQMAARVLHSVREAYIETWTPEDMMHLLRWLTRYPTSQSKRQAVRPASAYPASVQRLMRSLGGPRAAHTRLRIIADRWQERYPLHGQILHKFLDGCERHEIVRYFVWQGLYEDTRIYRCIKELPLRLSDQFRLDQTIATLD